MTRRFIAATWRTVLLDKWAAFQHRYETKPLFRAAVETGVVIAFIYTASLGLHVALGIAKDVLG